MRKDERYTWTREDDMELVEAVLRHVRNGGSAIDGCREFANKTGDERSVDAVKFRFHTQLKKHHETAYNIAKEQGRKIKAERRRHVTQDERFEDIIENVLEKDDKEVEIEDVYILLKKYMKQEPAKNNEEVVHLRSVNSKLLSQIKELQDSNRKMNQAFNEIEHDYKEIKKAISVLKSAGLAIEVPAPTNTRKYKVDANGLVELVE